jgi:hypothetical protein
MACPEQSTAPPPGLLVAACGAGAISSWWKSASHPALQLLVPDASGVTSPEARFFARSGNVSPDGGVTLTGRATASGQPVQRAPPPLRGRYRSHRATPFRCPLHAVVTAVWAWQQRERPWTWGRRPASMRIARDPRHGVIMARIVLSAAKFLGLDSADWSIIGAIAGVATFVAALAFGMIEGRVARRSARLSTGPPGDATDDLEAWRAWLCRRVIDKRIAGQYHEMVPGRHGIPPRSLMVTLGDSDAERPRLRIAGQLVAWSELVATWGRSEGQMVILGEPGYGKTVAALTLIAEINSMKAAGTAVAELFSLADWYRWARDHSGGTVREWIAVQLRVTYPDITHDAAAALVTADLVVPILDGLDEIAAADGRRECVNAIGDFAGGRSHTRSFVVTSRFREYAELAPDWVSADTHVVLAGLQCDQISPILEKAALGRPDWRELWTRHGGGDAELARLFSSPLRLTTALQVYEKRDARDLLDLDLTDAKAQLWQLLIETESRQFAGATHDQTLRWLTFLARGLQRTGRQRFVLHELYLMDGGAADERRFRRGVAGLLGSVGLLVAIPILGPTAGIAFGCAYMLATLRFVQAVPSVRGSATWRDRAMIARSRLRGTAVLALAGGLCMALATAARFDLFVGIVVAGGVLLILLGLLLVLTLREATESLAAGPPPRFAGRQFDATLVESRRHGVFVGLVCGFFYGVVTGLVSAVTAGTAASLIFGMAVAVSGFLMGAFVVPVAAAVAGGLSIGKLAPVVFGTLVGLAVGLAFALRGGFGAWCYHYWLRANLARRKLAPIRLSGFIDWCAEPGRGWLRTSDGCEFRHRELLEYLASRPDTPLNSGGEITADPA